MRCLSALLANIKHTMQHTTDILGDKIIYRQTSSVQFPNQPFMEIPIPCLWGLHALPKVPSPELLSLPDQTCPALLAEGQAFSEAS